MVSTTGTIVIAPAPTQKLRDLIEGNACGLVLADELHNGLLELETLMGWTLTETNRNGAFMTQAAVLEKDWKASATNAIETLAKSGGTFNADTLRERGITEPDHPNQWGALFGAAHKRGLITKADYSSSQRKSRHGGFLHAWKGVPRAGA